MATANQDQHWVGVTATFNDSHTPPRAAPIDQSDHPPAVASSDETVLTIANVVVAADSMSVSFDVETVAPGMARVTVTADANTAPGQTNDITLTSEDVTVTAGAPGQATGGNILFSAATPKP